MISYYIKLELKLFKKDPALLEDEGLYRQGRKITILRDDMTKGAFGDKTKRALAKYFCHVLKVFLNSIPKILEEIYKDGLDD